MSSSSIKVYEYAGCSTCKKALKYLDANKVKYQTIPIVEQPEPGKCIFTNEDSPQRVIFAKSY